MLPPVFTVPYADFPTGAGIACYTIIAKVRSDAIGNSLIGYRLPDLAATEANMKKNGSLKAIERRALQHLADNGPGPLPSGIGSVTIYNLRQHGWMISSERAVEFGKSCYALTVAGEQRLRRCEE